MRKDDEVTVVRGTYKVHSHAFRAVSCDFALHNV